MAEGRTERELGLNKGDSSSETVGRERWVVLLLGPIWRVYSYLLEWSQDHLADNHKKDPI